LRQFDVLENPNPASRGYAPFLIVLQSHHLAPLETVFVAPLVNDARRVLSALDVPVAFIGQSLTVAIAEAAGVPRASVGQRKGSLASYEDDIRRAFERLLSGF
jgi:toxin CcdB